MMKGTILPFLIQREKTPMKLYDTRKISELTDFEWFLCMAGSSIGYWLLAQYSHGDDVVPFVAWALGAFSGFAGMLVALIFLWPSMRSIFQNDAAGPCRVLFYTTRFFWPWGLAGFHLSMAALSALSLCISLPMMFWYLLPVISVALAVAASLVARHVKHVEPRP